MLESAFIWAEKEDPDRERAARNLTRVIDYLEGPRPCKLSNHVVKSAV
jgi:hypothetical protein